MKKVREGYKITEFGEIPEEWNISKLSEITELITKGATPMTYGFDFEDEGINFIKVENIMESGKIDKNSLLKISEECNNKLSRSKIQKGDILMSIAGTLGRTAIISEEVIPANTNQALAIIRLKKINNVDYINKTLSSSYIKKHINMIGTVGAQPNLSLKQIGDFNILLPSIKEQEKIASILSTVDEQIDNVDALIEKNKELKKGLMQTLLTKGIGHTKFKKTEIGEIPEEWEVKKLECVFEILDSMRKPIKASDREKIEGNIPYYGASGVIDWINDYIFDEELILLGEDGENLNSRNSDLAFKISGKTWVNNHAHVFRVINKKECNIDFMVYYLEAKDYSIYIAGSAQPKITQAQCRKFLLPLPEKQEQDKIASILLESDKKIEEYENKKQKLEELKKGLMQELLTGNIRVNN